MLDKYIQIRERQIICGQNASGVWYCKELPCDNTCELDKKISEINKILNKYNKPNTEKKIKKEIKPMVKGLE